MDSNESTGAVLDADVFRYIRSQKFVCLVFKISQDSIPTMVIVDMVKAPIYNAWNTRNGTLLVPDFDDLERWRKYVDIIPDIDTPALIKKMMARTNTGVLVSICK